MEDPNCPREPKRGSVSCTQLLGGQPVTMERLEKQAAEIVKARTELAEREESSNGTLTPPGSAVGQRAMVMRKMEGLARSFSGSFTTTRSTLKRSFSTGGRNSYKISAPGPAMRFNREKDKEVRQTLHSRVITHITTTIDAAQVTIRITSLYMIPDFPPYLFDELLSLRTLESICAIISPPISKNPLAKPPPKPQLSTAFREARKEAQDATHRLWSVMCKKRASRAEKTPSSEVKTKVVSLGIMAITWPRGVQKLGFRDHVNMKCDEDSWAFEFCHKQSKETLGSGIFGFLKELGAFDDERMQPSKEDLKQNGIQPKDFAHEGNCGALGCGEQTIDAMMELRGWNGILDG